MGFKGLKRVVAKQDSVGTVFNRVEDIETGAKFDRRDGHTLEVNTLEREVVHKEKVMLSLLRAILGF